jgi:hypothetical protein
MLIVRSLLVKKKGPSQGAEPRLTKIIALLKSTERSADRVKEAMRACLNYAEANVKVFVDGGLLDTMVSLYSAYVQDKEFLITFLWLSRNLAVPTDLRRTVLEKHGFIVCNVISANSQNPSIAEQGLYALGNMALVGKGYLDLNRTYRGIRRRSWNHADFHGIFIHHKEHYGPITGT